MNEKMVFSIPEFAQLLGIGQNNAYILAREGKIPAVKIGSRRWVIPKQALEDWLKEQATKQAAGE